MSDLTRRRFLGTASAASAAAWLGGSAEGAGAGPAAGEDGRMSIGLSKWDLDTPALCVDLDRLERNLATLQAQVSGAGIASRPHAKTHKCPAIARLQLASGAVGICVAKLSEAEVMFEHGVDRLLLTTSNVTPSKIKRAMQLRKWCDGFIQAVDTPANARELSDAAREAGVTADVVVDVDPGGHRTGIEPGDPAVALAQLVDQLPNLQLRGMLCYDGGSQHVAGFEARRTQALERLAPAGETFAAMQRAGLNVEIFSGGGTGTYNIDHETAGFTDVQAGSYVFMDAQYMAIGGRDGEVYTDFEPSLTVVTTVLNASYEGRATTDAGAKALTINRPGAIVAGATGMTYGSGSDEFGTIRYDNPSRTFAVGDRLDVIVAHCDPVVNLYDRLYGVRADRVETVWPIAARGRSQ